MEFLLKVGFLQRWFGSKPDDSRAAARERLKGALVGDRSSVAPNLLPAMEGELQAVLERYFDFKRKDLRLALAEREGQMHFSLQLPVSQVHRQARLPKEALLSAESSGESRKLPRRMRGTRRGSASSSGEFSSVE